MRIAIVGAGIVGSAIAYELAMDGQYDITVYDQTCGPVQENQSFYAGGTGAALGVLMGAICKKEKGRNLRRRLAGLDWYDRVIPELEKTIGVHVPYNRQGILMMQYEGDRSEQDLAQWETLALCRLSQNRRLEIWQPEHIQRACPQVRAEGLDRIVAAIYSPNDRQVHPTLLTQALITAAQLRGVRFCWNIAVGIEEGGELPACDVMVVSAGLGSSDIMRSIAAVNPLDLRPVLGQAIHVRMPEPLGQPAFQPVITGHDTHVVPLEQHPENRDYWVGATVEFEPDASLGDPIAGPEAKPEAFEAMWEKAIALVPELAGAERVRTWQGMRPRPVGRPAPVIEWATDFDGPKILLATGHYRNGVLLAPATAIEVREMLGTIG